MSDVSDRLAALGQLFADRNKVYGDDYLDHGKIMAILFPGGLTIKTSDDFNRFAILKEVVTKLARYTKNFTKGGHEDSLNDLAVYAQMLQSLDKSQTLMITPTKGGIER